jgi:regulator of RNase E activity RraA
MLGFAIHRRTRAVGTKAAAKFAQLPTSVVSDVMSRLQGSGARLRPMHAGGAMAGPALTVKSRPGDNLMIHKALDLIEPGDVLVVDAGDDLTNALVGEIMSSYAQQRGAAGIVIAGAIRDSGPLRRGKFPVFAEGVSHRGPYKDGPGEINIPVSLGGMLVHPGDLVLGDDDGLVCIPIDLVEDIYAAALAKFEAEEKNLTSIRAGEPQDRAWVDDTLRRLGCNTGPE